MHRWRVSQLLQKGYLHAKDSLLNDLALALRFIVITATARISGQCFSLVQSARAFWCGFVMLIDMIVGVPALYVPRYSDKIKEERCRYLVTELICRVNKLFLFSSNFKLKT